MGSRSYTARGYASPPGLDAHAFQLGTEVPRLATTRFAARLPGALGVRSVEDIRRRRPVAISGIVVDLPFHVLNAPCRGAKRLPQSQDCISRRRFGRKEDQ
jgi:hypothetical protein